MLTTMSSRQEELSVLRSYIKDVDIEVTMILQSLQWDRKVLLQCTPKSTCKYNSNHKIPQEKLKEHEEKCVLKSQGYAQDDLFLPDVSDPDSNTVLKLSSENIVDIINYASKTDPAFKRGDGTVKSEPLTLGRLQAAYSADERRAIYDVVITSRPACDELADLALGDAGAAPSQSKRKSKLEQLAELRDLRRRRTKYRVAVHSRNYSHTLRALIDTQMEMYAEAQGDITKPHDESDDRYPKIAEKQPHHSSGKNVNEHRGFSKEIHRYDSDRKNDRSEQRRKRVCYDDNNYRKYEKDRRQRSPEERITHDGNRRRKQDGTRDAYKEERDVDKRKRAHGDHKNARAFDKGRYLTSREERKRNDDTDKSRKQERYRDLCRKEIDIKHNSDKFIGSTTYIKQEKHIYRSSSIDSHRDREGEIEGRYYNDKDRYGIKQERDRYSSSTRDIQKYHGCEREVSYLPFDKDKGGIYIKQERDLYSSCSTDSQRYRESE